jgi:hypothetical protein
MEQVCIRGWRQRGDGRGYKFNVCRSIPYIFRKMSCEMLITRKPKSKIKHQTFHLVQSIHASEVSFHSDKHAPHHFEVSSTWGFLSISGRRSHINCRPSSNRPRLLKRNTTSMSNISVTYIMTLTTDHIGSRVSSWQVHYRFISILCNYGSRWWIGPLVWRYSLSIATSSTPAKEIRFISSTLSPGRKIDSNVCAGYTALLCIERLFHVRQDVGEVLTRKGLYSDIVSLLVVLKGFRSVFWERPR